jgi:ABC-type glutathione transport system ATPase component
VFQNPFSGTAPTLSVAENLALATRRGLPRTLGWALRGGRESEMREAVRRLNMGLEDRLPDPIGTLSGGQRQALTLLMATWRKPKLLLLDEHTAALDPKSADQVIRLSEDIISHNKLTALMVTHWMQQAAHLGDRLIMMHRGRVTHDLQGTEKQRTRAEELLARFEEIRRADQLDETAAEMRSTEPKLSPGITITHPRRSPSLNGSAFMPLRFAAAHRFLAAREIRFLPSAESRPRSDSCALADGFFAAPELTRHAACIENLPYGFQQHAGKKWLRKEGAIGV